MTVQWILQTAYACHYCYTSDMLRWRGILELKVLLFDRWPEIRTDWALYLIVDLLKVACGQIWKLRLTTDSRHLDCIQLTHIPGHEVSGNSHFADINESLMHKLINHTDFCPSIEQSLIQFVRIFDASYLLEYGLKGSRIAGALQSPLQPLRVAP